MNNDKDIYEFLKDKFPDEMAETFEEHKECVEFSRVFFTKRPKLTFKIRILFEGEEEWKYYDSIKLLCDAHKILPSKLNYFYTTHRGQYSSGTIKDKDGIILKIKGVQRCSVSDFAAGVKPFTQALMLHANYTEVSALLKYQEYMYM